MFGIFSVRLAGVGAISLALFTAGLVSVPSFPTTGAGLPPAGQTVAVNRAHKADRLPVLGPAVRPELGSPAAPSPAGAVAGGAVVHTTVGANSARLRSRLQPDLLAAFGARLQALHRVNENSRRRRARNFSGFRPEPASPRSILPAERNPTRSGIFISPGENRRGLEPGRGQAEL